MHHSADDKKRRTALTFPGIVLAAILVLGSCGGGDSFYDFKDPSGEPIKAAIRTTVPLAYAASVAMSAVTGSIPPNATINTTTCTPLTPSNCFATITITDDDSSMPLGLASAGTITVFGYWSSPTQAIFTVTFSGNAGSSIFPVHNISIFPVSKTSSGLRIVYVSIDVNVATAKKPEDLTSEERNAAFLKLNRTASSEASANVNMNAWIIQSNDSGTPDNVSDDTYSISGGGQYIAVGSGASVLQLGMANVVMAPDCLRNPDTGFAALNELATSSSSVVLATALLTFHSSCSGTAKVTGAIGNYLLANGDSIPLNLDSP